jgi:diketogulonate reductase-like aldo/keto reductase
MEADFSNDQNYIDDIRRSLDMWINLIDTAELYWKWHTEEIVWKAIKGYDRKNLFISSKVFKTNLHYHDLINSAKNSLERLWVDFFDLYIIHSPNDEIDIKETIEAMNYLVEQWLTKNIGVSNFKKETLASAQSFSKAKIVLNQCHYNLIYREPEITWLNSYCCDNDIILQAWRPLQFWDILDKDIDLLENLSKKYWKTISQIALNWLISQKNVTTISKMSKIEHIQENLWAIWRKMEDKDIELLMKSYPNQKNISDRVPLR